MTGNEDATILFVMAKSFGQEIHSRERIKKGKSRPQNYGGSGCKNGEAANEDPYVYRNKFRPLSAAGAYKAH
jgi:hypothetical protein